VGWYQKGKTNLDFTEARDSECQWHQLGHMQVCIAPDRLPRQHLTTQCFTGRMPFLPPNQQHQSTEGSSHLASASENRQRAHMYHPTVNAVEDMVSAVLTMASLPF